jgi:hypothetical protein
VRSSLEQGLGLPLAQVVRSGRVWVTVTDEDGLPLPNAQVQVEGVFVATQSSCRVLIESSDNRLVCQANDDGRVIFTLYGEQALTATPVALTAISADRTLQGQTETIFIPPATLEVMVTARPL